MALPPTLPPVPPSTSDPANFDPRADAFVAWLYQFGYDLPDVVNLIYAGIAASVGTIAATGNTTDSLQATTGNKNFKIESGKAIAVGFTMIFRKNSNNADSFTGNVTAYNVNTGDISINSTYVTGSTTAANGWQGVIARTVADGGTLMIRNEQASGTGSTENLTLNVYSTRLLNTVLANTISGASLSNSQITLPPGTYEFTGQTPIQGPGNNASVNFKCRLRNISDSTYQYGTQGFLLNTAVGLNTIEGRFTTTAQKIFDLQQFVSSSTGQPNGGFLLGQGPEVYSTLTFRKVG